MIDWLEELGLKRARPARKGARLGQTGTRQPSRDACLLDT
jgi:hypothetical protein